MCIPSGDLEHSLDVEFLKTFVQVHKLASDDPALDLGEVKELKEATEEGLNNDNVEKEEGAGGIFLQFRLWEQGRLDLEDMLDRLEAIVKHALWEVVTEYYMMPNDFMASTSMNGLCHDCLNLEMVSSFCIILMVI